MHRLLREVVEDSVLNHWLHNRSRGEFVTDACLKAAACTVKSSAPLLKPVPADRHPGQKDRYVLPGPAFGQSLVRSMHAVRPPRPPAAVATHSAGEESQGAGEESQGAGEESQGAGCEDHSGLCSEQDDHNCHNLENQASDNNRRPRLGADGNEPAWSVAGSDALCGAYAVASPAGHGVTRLHPDQHDLLACSSSGTSTGASMVTTISASASAWSASTISAENPLPDCPSPEMKDITRSCTPGLTFNTRTSRSPHLYQYRENDRKPISEQNRYKESLPGAKHATSVKLSAQEETLRVPVAESDGASSSSSSNSVEMGSLKSTTETLFIPIFRKGRFLLGEISGNTTPNAYLLGLLTGHQNSFVSIGRRFVADLCLNNSLEYVEYEWFEGGLLVVVVHTFSYDCGYTGRYILFGPDNRPSEGPSFPLKVLLTLSFVGRADCPRCIERDIVCTCEHPVRWDLSPRAKGKSWSWSQWIGSLHETQRPSTARVNVTVHKCTGKVRQSFAFRFQRIEVDSTRALCLSYQYASSVSLKRASPTFTDHYFRCDMNGPRLPDQPGAPNFPSETVRSPLLRLTDANCSRDVASNGGLRLGYRERCDASEAGGALNRSKKGIEAGGRGPQRRIKKNYSCGCGIVFSHFGHYNAHNRAVHMKLRPHQCSACTMSFAKGSDLRRHASAVHNVSTEQPLYTCPGCSTEFRRGSQLTLHRRFVHEGNSSLFECSADGCDGIFATRQGLTKHFAAKHA